MLRILLVVTAAALPLGVRPAAAQHVPLPADLSGTLNGAEYRIRVPANWNGTLLLYAHASATTDVEVAPPTFPPVSPSLEEQLLESGYALAGSFYATLKEGPLRTLALADFFRGRVANPRRIIVWGLSLGGDIGCSAAVSLPGHGARSRRSGRSQCSCPSRPRSQCPCRG